MDINPMKTLNTSLISSSQLILYTVIALLVCSTPSSSQLSPSFYELSCPGVDFLVRSAVRSATNSDSSIPGKLLRLMFHDCIVEGCDGSILIQGSGSERTDAASKTLGGFEVIDSAKRMTELFCPGTVSCADIVVLAARDAVELSGGPSVEVPLGRRDGRVSSASNVRPNMVDTSFSVDQMEKLFSSKGMSTEDLVALSGAHTIGSAHCNAFWDRFGLANGTLVPIDNTIDPNYATQLTSKCPAGTNDRVTVSNDPVTAKLFDNQYYTNLLENKGLLKSDAILVTDSKTLATVQTFAQNQDSFFSSWANAFVKLSMVDVKTGDNGEIRFSCSSVN